MDRRASALRPIGAKGTYLEAKKTCRECSYDSWVQEEDGVAACCDIHSGVGEDSSDRRRAAGTCLGEDTGPMKRALDNAVITVEPCEAPTEQRDLVIVVARSK